MSRRAVKLLVATLAIVAIGCAATTGITWWHVRQQASKVAPDPTPVPVALLRQPIPPGPDAALLERGRTLAIAGDCVSCHLRIGGKPFEGGLGLQTPFGVIYSANITGDAEAGIGGWTKDDFWRAMSQGRGQHGENLYPGFPYNYFTRISREDSDAILAFLKTVPASAYRPPENLLPFPFNIRPILMGWNLLFLKDDRFKPDASRPPAWNRGAELVNGLGHCGACHTPMTLAGSPDTDRFLQGNLLNGWWAPDLTENLRVGLGAWSEADIAEYLKTGRNDHANAAGPMGEVVSYSTSLMSDADLSAIATYLKSMPASPDRVSDAPDPGAMQRGSAVYADACSACHLSDGRGQPGMFPPLKGSAVAQQHDPAGIIRITLGGARTGPTPQRPSPLTMPSFAWKLTDRQVADVATYVRNSWDNRASSVVPDGVGKARASGTFPAPLAQRDAGEQH